MKHITEKEISDYVNAALKNHEEQRVEVHLEACDDCFQLYMKEIELSSYSPVLSETFTTDTLSLIKNQDASFAAKSSKSPESNQRKKQTLTHYLLAAGLTILLMVTGAFQSMLSITEQTRPENQVSVTNQLMNKTTNWLDQLKGELNK